MNAPLKPLETDLGANQIAAIGIPTMATTYATIHRVIRGAWVRTSTTTATVAKKISNPNKAIMPRTYIPGVQ